MSDKRGQERGGERTQERKEEGQGNREHVKMKKQG